MSTTNFDGATVGELAAAAVVMVDADDGLAAFVARRELEAAAARPVAEQLAAITEAKSFIDDDGAAAVAKARLAVTRALGQIHGLVVERLDTARALRLRPFTGAEDDDELEAAAVTATRTLIARWAEGWARGDRRHPVDSFALAADQLGVNRGELAEVLDDDLESLRKRVSRAGAAPASGGDRFRDRLRKLLRRARGDDDVV